MITWKIRFNMLQLSTTKLVNFLRKKNPQENFSSKKSHMKKISRKFILPCFHLIETLIVLEITFIFLLILSRTRNMLIKKNCFLHGVLHTKVRVKKQQKKLSLTYEMYLSLELKSSNLKEQKMIPVDLAYYMNVSFFQIKYQGFLLIFFIQLSCKFKNVNTPIKVFQGNTQKVQIKTRVTRVF